MTISPSDLGELGALARAIGLVSGSGGFQEDWLSRPGHYLANVLADADQRNALVELVDELLGGSERETVNGLSWLPLVENANPNLTLYLVLDDRPSEQVNI